MHEDIEGVDDGEADAKRLSSTFASIFRLMLLHGAVIPAIAIQFVIGLRRSHLQGSYRMLQVGW